MWHYKFLPNKSEITVMHLKGQTSNWTLFGNRMTAQQPVKLSDTTMTQSDTIFFLIKVLRLRMCHHVIDFKFVPREPSQVTKITLHKLTSGVFNIIKKYYLVSWNGIENHTFPLKKPARWSLIHIYWQHWINAPVHKNTFQTLKKGNSTASTIVVSATSMANTWPPQN